MGYAAELDPTGSVLSFYATDLRRARERAGVPQAELARAAHMSPSLLNKVEATKRLPTFDLSVLCDELFGTGDHFQRLWKLVVRYAYPAWFRPWVELEQAATTIRSFQAQVVPGLLQTEEYARAVLAPSRPERAVADELLAALRERQLILTRQPPPELWLVLDENVLRRHIGSRAVMRAQLERLVAAAESPSTVIQVVPYSVGGHAGAAGPFAAMTLDEGPDVLYVDGFRQGQILADPADVKAALRTYDLLTATALSPDDSVALIAATAHALAG